MSGTSRYEIDIVANNKASKALSKTNKQLQKIDANAKKSNSALKSMGALAASAGAALGTIKLAQGFMNTARQFENLGVQLKFITGNAKSGAEALDIVEAAAKRSSFAMEDMAAAAPSLLTVSSVDQLASTLDMAGDIAAATGMSFQEVSSQLQRAFSGGIAAADMFREKGVKSMLGFQEGVEYTAEETERMIREAFENGSTSLAGATKDMAKTWDGQISMMGDAWTDFKKVTMESGVFDELKIQLSRVKGFIDKNKEAINDIAEALGKGLAVMVKALGDSIAFVVEHSRFFATVATTLVGIKLFSWIARSGAAMKLLNLAFKMSPIGRLIGLVTGLAAVFSLNNGLGRTIAQVQAVLDSLGGALANFGRFLYGKMGEVLDWIKGKFYDFVDGIIDAYNWIAELIPGMTTFDKSARELSGSLSAMAKDGFEYVKTAATDAGKAVLGMLPEELTQAILDAAEAAGIAGTEYDALHEELDRQRKVQEALIAVQNSSTVGATANATATGKLADETKRLAEEQKKAKTAAEEWATEWTRLQEQLFPTETRLAEINELIGVLETKIAAGEDKTGRMAIAVALLRKEAASLDPELQQLIADMQGYDDAIMRVVRNQEADAQAKLDLKEAALSLYDSMHPLETQLKRLTEQQDLNREAYEKQLITMEQYMKTHNKLQEKIDETKESMKGLGTTLKETTEDMRTEGEKYVESFNKDFNRKLADGLANGTLSFKTFAGSWRKVLADLINDTLNGGTLLNDILGMFGNLFGGGGGGLTSLFDTKGTIDSFSQFAGDPFSSHMARNMGMYADGGKIAAGETGIVGEAGAELVTGPATVTPNKEIGGAKPAVNITIQAIDTQTGTEFLLKNKKQIEGIIQHAYNRRGKQGIY